MNQYTLDNAWQQARERLSRLESMADSGTIRHLEAIGVKEGWRCLEIGGGGGSIAAWLCGRTGVAGEVVAIDLDTRFLEVLDYPNLTVRRQNCVTEPLDTGAFDLVHARALLVHLAERERVLDSMVAALREGGWLLVEEPDYFSKVVDPSNDPDANALFQRARGAQAAAISGAGVDTGFGRGLYGALLRRGLTALGGEGRTPVIQGGTDAARFYRVTAEQLRDRAVGTGLSAADFDAYLALYDDPNFVFIEGTMMAAWGWRAV